MQKLTFVKQSCKSCKTFRWNRSGASDFAYSRIFVPWSVVCHIHAPCLNRSEDLHHQITCHLTGTHAGFNDTLGWNPSQNMHLFIYDSPEGSSDQRFRFFTELLRLLNVVSILNTRRRQDAVHVCKNVLLFKLLKEFHIFGNTNFIY